MVNVGSLYVVQRTRNHVWYGLENKNYGYVRPMILGECVLVISLGDRALLLTYDQHIVEILSCYLGDVEVNELCGLKLVRVS